MKFNLQTGMKDESLYAEIRGKVSGETSEQMLEFYHPKGTKDCPIPLHEVIDSNEKYALIRKNTSIMNREMFFLSGINDEDMYFMHEIPNRISHKSLDEIVNEINLKGLEFERIQGDLLIKFMPLDDKRIRVTEHGVTRTKGMFNKTLDERSLYPRTLTIDGLATDRYGWLMFHRMYYEFDSALTIFNSHRLEIDPLGKILHETNNLGYVIFGSHLKLKHREHQQVSINIPKNMCAILMAQQTERRQNHD